MRKRGTFFTMVKGKTQRDISLTERARAGQELMNINGPIVRENRVVVWWLES